MNTDGHEEPARPAFWRRLIPKHPIRRVVVLALLGLVLEYLILPQIAGVHKSLHLLSRVNLAYVALGVLLEAASLACYAQLTRAVLPPHTSTFSRIWRIDLATLAISHVLPGGTAGGEGLAYKLLTDEGASGGDTGFALATQGLGSAVVLNVILWLALIISIPVTGFNPIYGIAAAVGGVAIALFAAAVFSLTKGEERVATIVCHISARIPFMRKVDMGQLVHDLARRIRTMAADRALLWRAVTWAALNWFLDAAALFVFVAAFGHLENPDGLLVAYGIANVLSAIPVSPGGLGIVEGILVPSLVGFGAARGVAVLGVIGYRLINFWLPIPVGAASYLSLRKKGEGRPDKPSAELKKLVVEVAAAPPGHPGPADSGPDA